MKTLCFQGGFMIKRKIFILLLHFSDIGSLAMQYCTDFYYTHAVHITGGKQQYL